MKKTDTHVYFWGGPFSNWFQSNQKLAMFDDKEPIDFKNTEQAFMAFKALHFDDRDILAQICKTTDPKAVKALGRKVKNFDADVWTTVARDYMKRANLAKYLQNLELAKILIETKKLIIVEASPFDRIWGVGLSEDDPLILDTSNWKGTNWLGLTSLLLPHQV